jgi:hypothetical protein
MWSLDCSRSKEAIDAGAYKHNQLHILQEGETCVPPKKSILLQASNILPPVFFYIYGVNQFISRRCVGDIIWEREREKSENETCEGLNSLRGANLDIP